MSDDAESGIEDGGALIDPEELKRHVVGDANVERELLAIYVTDTQRDDARLNPAIEHRDFPGMAQVLLRKQRSAQIVAAKSVVQPCECAQ